MAVHDTEENGRLSMTKRTLRESIYPTAIVPWVINNGSYSEATDFLRDEERAGRINLINLPSNIGTAKAVNLGWSQRKPGQHCVKMDNDVIIYSTTWYLELQAAIQSHPDIGIIGLKRPDLWERPDHPDPFYRSVIDGPIEYVNHVMGTCQMFNSALLDIIGYLYQPGLYGFDDSLASYRAHIAGFRTAFLPHIRIDHIDHGHTPYQGWKESKALSEMAAFNVIKSEYKSGQRPIYSAATW